MPPRSAHHPRHQPAHIQHSSKQGGEGLGGPEPPLRHHQPAFAAGSAAMAIIHGEDLPTGTETGTPGGLGGVCKVEEGVAGRELVTLPNLNMTTESAAHGDGLAFVSD